MRLLVVASCVALAIGAAYAQDAQPQPPQPSFYDRVVQACEIETGRRPGATADQTAITSYCHCTVGLAQASFTSKQFDVLGRFGMASAGIGAAPDDEEVSATEDADFLARTQTMGERILRECRPILYGDPG